MAAAADGKSFTGAGGRHNTEGADWTQVNRFELRIEGVSIGEFQAIKMPEKEMEQIDYHVGSSRHALKRPGQFKCGDLELTRGWAHNTTLQDWFERIQAGQAERRSMSIDWISETDDIVATYNFYNCWPKKWKLADLDASKAEVAVETVTFAVENYERVA